MKKQQLDLFEVTIKALEDRGVKLERLAKIVVDLQKKFSPDINVEKALENIEAVLRKREVQHAVLTGIELDKLAERKLISEPLLSIIVRDEPLYGVDEALGMSIAEGYGNIAKSNFGYLDISKPDIIGEFNNKKNDAGQVHTMLDDLLSAIVGSACGRFAHN